MDGGDYCLDCGRVTEVAHDHASGDAICMECGLVLESRIIDETAEWRTFASDDAADRDPARVGAPSNPLIEGHMLETVTVVANNNNAGKMKERWVGQLPSVARAAASSNPNASLVRGFGKIDDICERLAVNKIVKDLACEIYAKLHPHTTRKSRDNATVAACVHIASQKENQSRTLKEMCMAANGVAEKKIVSAKNSIMRLLNDKDRPTLELGTEQANDYLKRFAYNLGLNNHAIRAAQEIFKKSQELVIRGTPKSVAAGIIYITCQLCGHKRSARDISLVANTAEATIKKSYKELHPYLPLIVPSWFATQNDLQKLYAP
uniref:TFIIB-type domain-containing protein n=1 Tax=Kalanchoe fedtschenkoi TaxID=63787 RepID=A0A7N1A6I0_KALFE